MKLAEKSFEAGRLLVSGWLDDQMRSRLTACVLCAWDVAPAVPDGFLSRAMYPNKPLA